MSPKSLRFKFSQCQLHRNWLTCTKSLKNLLLSKSLSKLWFQLITCQLVLEITILSILLRTWSWILPVKMKRDRTLWEILLSCNNRTSGTRDLSLTIRLNTNRWIHSRLVVCSLTRSISLLLLKTWMTKLLLVKLNLVLWNLSGSFLFLYPSMSRLPQQSWLLANMQLCKSLTPLLNAVISLEFILTLNKWPS